MLEQIQAVLAEITQAYADRRIHYCHLEATTLSEARCLLAGSVLDQETAQAVVQGLAARFPQLTFDASGVKVLRPGSHLAVGTNVTGLYAAPSFLAEMVNQLLNGWTLEVLKEQERWAFVRQEDGYLGWAYRPYLVDANVPPPTHLVSTPLSLLRQHASVGAPLVGRLPGGTHVAVTDGQGDWARLALAGGTGGWVATADLRALDDLPQGEAAQREQLVADAATFVGVPYQWGGGTALGIDCSGYAQLLHRLVGVAIPRDADMQYEAGQPVAPPFQPGDLLFFSSNGHRAITHVAVSLGGWRVIHSSRARNGVYEDDVQSVESLRQSFVGARAFL